MARGDRSLAGNDYAIWNWYLWMWAKHYMRGGDLSNELAPAIGFRFEEVIKTAEGKLNRAAKGFIEQVGRLNTNIYIITTGPQRKALAFIVKWGIPYTHVIEAETRLEVADIAREHDLITFFDVDTEVILNLNTRGNKKVKGELWTHREVS